MEKNKLKNKILKARQSLGLNGESQRDLLRKVREAFDVSNDQLAEALGVSLSTLLAYLAPESNAKHRKLPEADKLVLSRVLVSKRTKRN